MTDHGYERPGIAGSGTIATGLAAVASTLGEVVMLARSDASAWRAEEKAQKAASKLEGAVTGRIKVTTDASELAGCDVVVEAIAENLETKSGFLKTLGESAPDADLASTTSSLSIGALIDATGLGGRLYGLHVFNPVPRMELIELCLPDGSRDGLADRARAWCAGLDKTAVEVPDTTGFVVNRLLFPYLFDAARFMEDNGMTAAAVDDCMRLGAGHPMGPLKLLDFVGLDVSKAIGDSLVAASGDDKQGAPPIVDKLIAEGKLGRKSGEGFYTY